MPRICYIEKNFTAKSETLIATANDIIREYQAQGFTLTLRQLYYQFVARDMLENKQRNYAKLGSVINNARLAGRIDWHSIIDRTRFLRANTHWNSPSEILRASADGYRIDKWARQPCRIDVWIEKDALVGVIERVCRDLDVPHFACRGYNSQSEMWRASQRMITYATNEQRVIILHLGDHDPSGIDMTRDTIDRLRMFTNNSVTVRRIALNMSQVEEHSPPPNFAKLSDSRAEAYIEEFGYNSWELDALEPSMIESLIREHVERERDQDLWDEAVEEEDEVKERLTAVADEWEDD